MSGPATAGRWLGSVLIDPVGTNRLATRDPRPWTMLLTLVVGLSALGAATLPRQVVLLNRTLGPTGDLVFDAQNAVMQSGLLRLIIADRLVPSPTLLIAAVLLVLAAEPVLAMAHDVRPAIWGTALLGLAPLFVERIGELAITYLLPLGAHVTPGDAVSAPHRFVTGPLVFWHRSEPAPAWLELLDPRVNLVALWCVVIWAVALRQLDGGKLRAWHIALPLTCLVAAGVLTWILAPMAVGALLGRP